LALGGEGASSGHQRIQKWGGVDAHTHTTQSTGGNYYLCFLPTPWGEGGGSTRALGNEASGGSGSGAMCIRVGRDGGGGKCREQRIKRPLGGKRSAVQTPRSEARASLSSFFLFIYISIRTSWLLTIKRQRRPLL